MKPTCFGLLDFAAGYHQTRLHPASRVLTAFRAAGDLYGTEKSWSLLSTQYAEQGPQRPCLRDMRNIHR